jgi:hypothetical protein
MVGGEITVTNINLTDSEKSTLSGFGNDGVGAVSQEDINEMFTFPTYKARVESVISDKQLTTSKPYSLQFESPSVGELRMYSDIGSSSPSDNLYASYSASYLDWAVPTTSSYRFDTIVDLDISNLRTFSGDVYRMKVYGASDSAQGEFPVLLDTIVESPETLVDNDILKFPLRTGYFLDQDHIDKYWNSFGGDNNTGTINTVSTSTVYVDGLYISGSYRGYKEVGRFELDQDYAFTVKKDIPYTLSFQATAKKTEKVVNSGGKVESYAKLMIHLSGSNLSADSRLDITHASSFGQSLTNATNQKVGLELKTDEPYTSYDFPRVSHTFFPKFKLDTVKNDDTIIQFRIEAGEWYISDVSLKPARDTGFSPDEMKIRIPLPPNTQRPDNYDFFLEYYDINGNTAEATTFVNNVGISGSALVVEGGDNLLTGSLFIGNLQGQGIEMAGANSAYMRSIGYEGFVSASAGQGGFMIFSGSVLPDAPDDYAGAGLEIHDGTVGDDESFFKFRTNPSEFRVKTDSFFFGNKTSGQFISGSNGNLVMSSSRFFLGGDSSFISGSNGNIEITSSNFHLQPDGDVVMQGTITAEAGGTIGGFSIGTDNLTATDFVLNTTDKSIKLGDTSTSNVFIADADTGIQLGNTTFSSAPFSVTPAGAVSASSGNVGGWAISDSQISSGNLTIHNSGYIESNDYEPQFDGFIITADGGDGASFAEFGNARIRGTLRTTTFEKETVNAVGGQVWIANSTVVTKSVAASDDEIVCENVSGFRPDEIIFAKKISNTGFTKEFMKVTSSSREDSASDTNFVGTLFVDRETNEISSSYTSSITNLDGAIDAEQTVLTVDDNAPLLERSIIKIDHEYMKVMTASLDTKIEVIRGADGSQKAAHSDNAVVGQLSREAAMIASFLSPRETYTPGQVLVSTGRYLGGTGSNTTGSGYMLLNANPSTGDTPFMDFVERTGSGVYDVKMKTRLGDLSGLKRSAFGREVGISDDPGFGLASENVFLSGMIRANSGSIGGISMGAQKLFIGAGSHGNDDTGFYVSSSGDFSLKSSFIWDSDTGTLDISGSAVRFNTPEFVLGGLNNFISGSTGGLNINFPSFSVSTAGIMTATDGNFKGNISATSGFIGSGTGSGWNIDGSTIGDVNNIIELDANQDSPNITITSGSFVAEFVPDFTPANIILSAGGNSYSASIALGNLTDASWNGSAFSFTNNNGDTDTTNVSTGQTSNVLELFGGFTGTQGGGASTHTTSGSITDVTLSGGNKVYKSTATVRISIAVDSPQFSNNSTITGTATIGGNITLRAASDNSIVATQVLSSNLNIDRDTFASTTRINKNVNVSFNHTVVTDTTDFYFEIDDVTVTNNGITESYITGGKTITSTPDITAIAAYFTAMSHQPSNKKTEIAPAGIQTVLLGNSTLENSANTFVRISPEEPKTLETQGSVHVTGSIQIRELGASDTTTVGSDITTTGHIETSEYLKTGNGDENTPAIQLGSANDGLYHSGGISFVINNDTTVLFADGGHIHADNDVTAFSTSVTSDIRLKENIKPLKNNLNKILQLKPSSFTWLVKDKQDDIGLIAQEVEKIIPEVIKTNVSIGKTKEFLKGDNHKTVDYSKITTHLIGAIQEQQKQIDELKKKLEEL